MSSSLSSFEITIEGGGGPGGEVCDSILRPGLGLLPVSINEIRDIRKRRKRERERARMREKGIKTAKYTQNIETKTHTYTHK